MYSNNFPINVVNNPLTESIYSQPNSTGGFNPPPVDAAFWISNVGNIMISNTGSPIVFGGPVPPPGNDIWVTNNNDDMVDNLGNFLVFSE